MSSCVYHQVKPTTWSLKHLKSPSSSVGGKGQITARGGAVMQSYTLFFIFKAQIWGQNLLSLMKLGRLLSTPAPTLDVRKIPPATATVTAVVRNTDLFHVFLGIKPNCKWCLGLAEFNLLTFNTHHHLIGRLDVYSWFTSLNKRLHHFTWSYFEELIVPWNHLFLHLGKF